MMIVRIRGAGLVEELAELLDPIVLEAIARAAAKSVGRGTGTGNRAERRARRLEEIRGKKWTKRTKSRPSPHR